MDTPTTGPAWVFVVSVLCSIISFLSAIVVGMVSWQYKRLETRMTVVENNHNTFYALVGKEYPTRQEIAESFQRMENLFQKATDRLEDRMDRLLSAANSGT